MTTIKIDLPESMAKQMLPAWKGMLKSPMVSRIMTPEVRKQMDKVIKQIEEGLNANRNI